MKIASVVLSAIAFASVLTAAPVYSQSSDDLKEGVTHHDKSGKREVRYTTGDMAKTIRLKVSGNLDSGRIVVSLRDQNGKERWAKELNSTNKGKFELDSGELAPANGTWILKIELDHATASYNTVWILH